MMRRGAPPESSAYVDTSVLSAHVKNELPSSEQDAFESILDSYSKGLLQLLVSTVVEDEINQIPKIYRSPHESLLRIFMAIPKATVGGVTMLGGSGRPIGNPRRRKLARLKEILRDENDVWHVFTASANHVSYFLTVDRRTVLKHAPLVFVACGVLPVTPREFEACRSAKNAP